MAKLTVTISDELDKRFRIKLIELGQKRGDMSVIVEAGIREWIETQEEV